MLPASARPTGSAEVRIDGQDIAAPPYWPGTGSAPVLLHIKAQPADFLVDEILGFEPDDRGNHRFLRLAREAASTADVARALAGVFDIPLNDVGYAGMKDRRAHSRQWFSVPESAVRKSGLDPSSAVSRTRLDLVLLAQRSHGAQTASWSAPGQSLSLACAGTG